MNKRKCDHSISGRPKHRERTRGDGAGVDAVEQGRVESKIVSIGDFEIVRDALLDILGPRGYRVAIARLSKRPTVVSIGTTSLTSTADSEDEPDLDVRNEGTIIVFTPRTEAGKYFLKEVLYTDPYQWFGGDTLCIDQRMAQGVIDAAASEGLRINVTELGSFE
jgi:hypothetical protein